MRPFVIIVKPDDYIGFDEFVDYFKFLKAAAHGHGVSEEEILKQIEPYYRDGRLTVVFDLDGKRPEVLLNSNKGEQNAR